MGDPVGDQIQEGLTTDNPRALELIFEHLIPGERSWLRSRFRGALDSYELEDVLSSATLKAWNARRSFDPALSVRPWFHVIIRNEAFDRLRRRAREIQVERESDFPDPHGRVSSLLHGDLDALPVPGAAEEIMKSLSESDRELLREYITSGHSESWTTALAKRRGVSSASLRLKKHRLIKRLQSAFTEKVDDGAS